VFGIVPNLVPGAVTNVSLGFSLDGEPAGTYNHDPDMNNAAFQYNVSVFAKNSLSNTAHTLVIEPTSGGTQDQNTILLFDYAVYTFDDSLPPTVGNTYITSSSSSSCGAPTGQITSPGSSLRSTHSTGDIAGGVVGGVIAVLLTLLAVYVIARHRRKQKQPPLIPFTDTVPSSPPLVHLPRPPVPLPGPPVPPPRPSVLLPRPLPPVPNSGAPVSVRESLLSRTWDPPPTYASRSVRAMSDSGGLQH
jgi:hypothetical protein